MDQLISGTDHLVPRLNVTRRHGAGDVLNEAIGHKYGKCLDVDLLSLQSMDDRSERMLAQALEARAHMKKSFRVRYAIQRTVALKVLCQREFDTVTGNYLR